MQRSYRMKVAKMTLSGRGLDLGVDTDLQTGLYKQFWLFTAEHGVSIDGDELRGLKRVSG